MSDTDLELLARYTRYRAEDAFAELVRRHLDLVHSAALRQVRSPQLAEEVAQAAFLKLAHHARQLAPNTILTAWLYQVARREAIDVVRREARRQLREQVAVEMNAMNATADDWRPIEPLLDEAMHALDESDRAAVLLRYFENKSLREVGETLGTTDDTARKRVNRAIDRLREFFAQRGVTIGASGLMAVVSANAVQAAPAGLAISISTATFAATTLATATTSSAIPTIAMNTLQKTLLTGAFVALIGVTLYEARQAYVARGHLAELQRQHTHLTAQLEQMTRDREDAYRQIAALRRETDQRGRATDELLKLRGEVARLKADANELARLKSGGGDEQSFSEAVIWQQRAKQLKQHLAQNPAVGIPELQLATEQDWLAAARKNLETEADYRRAISQVRNAVEGRFASMLQKALSKFLAANDKQFPTDLRQLSPYLDSPVDEAVWSRWEILPAKTVKNIVVGGDTVITQKAPVDEVFDIRHVIGPNGSGSTDFFYNRVATVMKPVWEAFKSAHNGQDADDTIQLRPYATTPEQQAALEQMILRDTVTK